MTQSTIIPLGKHKGRDIAQMSHSEVHILWAAWNGFDHLRGHQFFNVIISELDKWSKKKAEGKNQVLTGERMQFGKHKGELINSIPINYLRWAAENISGSVGRSLQQELQRRKQTVSSVPSAKEPSKPKKRDRAIPDDSKTHYQWADRTGKVHMIPNDVSMEGTEDEECPFEVSEPVEGPAEQFGELDREFRAMFC